MEFGERMGAIFWWIAAWSTLLIIGNLIRCYDILENRCCMCKFSG